MFGTLKGKISAAIAVLEDKIAAGAEAEDEKELNDAKEAVANGHRALDEHLDSDENKQ